MILPKRFNKKPKIEEKNLSDTQEIKISEL